MAKVINKKNLIILIISSIAIITFLIISFNFKRLRGNINDYSKYGFKDENLYKCVYVSVLENFSVSSEEEMLELYGKIIDNYENFPVKELFSNIFNEMGIEEGYSLIKKLDLPINTEDFKNINSLSCDINISDYSGIDKLTSLEEIYFYSSSGKVDLSNNKNLREITISGGDNEKIHIDELIIPEGINRISIRNADIEKFLIKNDNNLEYIDISNSIINSELIFSENVALKNIQISNSKFNKIDFGNVKQASNVNISSDIKDIDLSNIEVSTSIIINSKSESVLLPKKTPSINSVIINSNNLSELDLSSSDNINVLQLNTPNLEKLQFKDGAVINTLQIQGSKIDYLDISNISISYLYGLGCVKNLKVNEVNYIQLPAYFEKLSYSNGDYIELNGEKVMYISDRFVFKDKDLTVGDVIKDSNVIKSNGLSFKICKTDNCIYGFTGSSEITDMSIKLKAIPGAYLTIYKGDVRLASFKIDVFDNEYFDNYILYKSVLSSIMNDPYAAIDVTDEQLKTVSSVSLAPDENLNGLEKLTGLTHIVVNGYSSSERTLPNNFFEKFSTIKSLSLYYVTLDNLNFSKNTDLQVIRIGNSEIEVLDVSNNLELTTLDIEDSKVKNVAFSQKNEKLEDVGIKNSGLNFVDVSKLLNLKKLLLNNNNLTEINISNNTLLKELNVNHNKLSSIDINNNTNLEELYISYNNISDFDISNNNNLYSVSFEHNPIKKFIGVKNLPLSNDDFWIFPFPELEKIDLEGCKYISNLVIISDKLKNIDISDCESLTILFLIGENFEEITIKNELKNLYGLIIPYSKIKNIDISKLSNLQALNIQFSTLSKNNIDMLVGENKSLDLKVDFPSAIKLEHYIEDDYIASYDEENNLIIANNIGQSVISSYFPSMTYDLGNITKAPIKTYVNVYDIKSSKFLINKGYKYVFNENNEPNKVLKRYIKVYGENTSKKIEDNKLYMYSGDKKIFTFDILEFTSEDYKIDNVKNVITYNDTFDINKLNVVNGSLNKIEDEIQLICNDNIVKTYKLEKK